MLLSVSHEVITEGGLIAFSLETVLLLFGLYGLHLAVIFLDFLLLWFKYRK
jgi:hypothetical protein